MRGANRRGELSVSHVLVRQMPLYNHTVDKLRSDLLDRVNYTRAMACDGLQLRMRWSGRQVIYGRFP